MFPIPPPKPTRKEKLVDGLTFVPSGNASYRPRGSRDDVVRFASYQTSIDDDAEREAEMIGRRGDRRRVKYGRC